MPVITSISDRRNKAKELSAICHDSATYERVQARLELCRLLDEAARDVHAGDRGVTVQTLRRRLGR